MNIVFLSPGFPPNYYNFCVRLRASGANVLGLGDTDFGEFRPELRNALTYYCQVSDLHNSEEVREALTLFSKRYGAIDRLESLNEYWLEAEARLRTQFGIPGFQVDDLPAIKRKSEMKRLFGQAGVAVARGHRVLDAEDARQFVKEVGYPVIAKPDIGVGADRTFKIAGELQLETFLVEAPSGFFLEEWVQGTIQTFDGLTDRNGNPVFSTSMQYSRGVMEVVVQDEDVFYYTQREIPSDLREAGLRVLKAFDVRERFFHFEFFRTPQGRLVALEVNMRPPGGLSLDMFNFASDIDLYQMWADVVLGHEIPSLPPPRYHCCYVSRKAHLPYAHSHAEVLSRVGPILAHWEPVSQVFRDALGDTGYVLRSADLDEILEAVRYFQERV